MSMQTKLAQAAAKDAETEWKQHAAVCPRCTRLKKDRSAEPCGPGAGLRNVARELRTVASCEVTLDKLPIEGQQALF